MSNSFPPVPTDLQLVSVTYMLNFNGPVGGGTPIGPAFTFTGVNTTTIGALGGLGGAGGVQFTFTTPGSAGSFDQAAAETQLGVIIKDIFQLMSDLSGVAVTTLATDVAITRNWLWADAAGNQATYTDTMAYPA